MKDAIISDPALLLLSVAFKSIEGGQSISDNDFVDGFLCVKLTLVYSMSPTSCFHNASHLACSTSKCSRLSQSLLTIRFEIKHLKGPGMSMEAYIASEEATRDLHEIVRERDELRKERNEIRIELRCAKTAVVELENQNLELDRMLRIAHSQLSEHVPKRSSNPAPKIVIGSWLASPEEYPGLRGAEDMWRNGHLQQALSQMPTIIEREDFGVRHQINARLLLSAIIQSSSHNLQTALQWAEEALRMASQEQRLLDLSGKAQFHRGLCYYYLGEYANAKWCLSLASHLEGHEQWVLDFQQKVDQYLQDLPEGDPKRFVSAGFKFFCHPKLDVFVYSDSVCQG